MTLKSDAKFEEKLTFDLRNDMENMVSFHQSKINNDAKFEEELTCCFKIDMRNLTNFDSSPRKSQKFAL